MSNINASKFQEMVQAAASRLNEQAEYVNSLNVFPVPDGDTGTNMGMTITNGAKDVASKPADTVGQVAQILSKGLLMGARGNSGVILSQLFRGFAQYVKDYEEIDGIHLAAALQNGVEVAYKAVMKPVEGTILTVSRGAAELAKRKTDETDDAVKIMEAALEGAKKALAMTPDMLPVLKEVGVVDSGGQTMNPSTEDILTAIEAVNAEKVIILPNNKNIFMAAKSAAEVAEIPVEVIESATVPQGFTALLSFDPTRSIEENKAAMTDALLDVKSGSVTTAIRDTNVDGIEIHKKDTLGMLNNKIVVSTRKMNDAIFAVFDQMIDEDSEIVAIYIGEEGKKANADKIAKELEKKYPEIEVEIHEGKQPVYPYLFSVE